MEGRDSPGKASDEPIGPADSAYDAVANLGTLDWGTGVTDRFASDGDLVIEFDLVFESIEGDLELGPFVFFDTDGGIELSVFDGDEHLASTTVSRCGERPAK